MQKSAFHALVRGEVQGVGYRYFAYQKANALSLQGFVRNLPDGRVEVYAEGIKTHLETFLEELRTGPRFAGVEDVEVNWEACKNRFDGFFIESSHGY